MSQTPDDKFREDLKKSMLDRSITYNELLKTYVSHLFCLTDEIIKIIQNFTSQELYVYDRCKTYTTYPNDIQDIFYKKYFQTVNVDIKYTTGRTLIEGEIDVKLDKLTMLVNKMDKKINLVIEFLKDNKLNAIN